VIFLDTAAVRDDRRITGRLNQYGGRIHIPWIVAAELKFGIEKLNRMGKSLGALRARIELLAMASCERQFSRLPDIKAIQPCIQQAHCVVVAWSLKTSHWISREMRRSQPCWRTQQWHHSP
jgi:hypothetical protein